MSTLNLKQLLAAVPTPALHLQAMADDKPAIFAGDQAVLRYRNSPEGRAYAALVVGAVNALPKLLAAHERPASEPDQSGGDPKTDTPLCRLMEEKIAQVLALQPEFRKASSKLLTKLLYAAIEPLMLPSSDAGQVGQPAAPVAAPNAKEIQTIRLEAVNDFCGFLLEKGESTHLPSEDTLSVYASNWHATQNLLVESDQ